MLQSVVLKPGPRPCEKPVLLYYTNAAPSGTASLPCLYWYGQSCGAAPIRRHYFYSFGRFPEWWETSLNDWSVIGVGDAKTLSLKFPDLDFGNAPPDQYFAVVRMKDPKINTKKYVLLIAAIILSSRDFISPYPYSGQPFSLPATPDS